MKKETRTICGVKVTIEECAHCKASPSDVDIKRAVEKAQQMRECPQRSCAYCGKPVKALSYNVHHDQHGWVAWENDIEPAISLFINPQNAPPAPG